ncbi:MAG: hypothetical protein IT328_13850 [Caldilineaceae bacterium]|nr:hypothetical protein [Caldilineaceae bacterium]
MDAGMSHGFKYPFGEVSCETEMEVLKEHYQDFYYNRTRFNLEVTDEDTYLIVGRRGSGKTSLAKYLEFQNVLENARCIDVNEPEIYDELFRKMNLSTYPSDDLLVERLVKLWNYIIWNLIFHSLQAEDPLIRAASLIKDRNPSPAKLIADILKYLLSRFINDQDRTVADEIEQFLASGPFAAGQKRALEITSRRPVIVAIDTIERYDKDDDRLMGIVASLIQAASWFNVTYARRGIHLKVFVSAEIFPHIKESVISNTTKYIRNPVYLRWRPRDLIHLICWRFYRYLEEHNHPSASSVSSVDWNNFDNVVDKMWLPFFGHTLINGMAKEEKTFPYILRHTQMRPRQLVVLCNQIARYALKNDAFPDFWKIPIIQIVRETEINLANEVLNSYALIYPRLSDIVDALQALPMMFEGKELDKVAKRSTAAWPPGEYSPDSFRKLVAELGIVGRVRSLDSTAKIVAADFEYALTDRLPLHSNDMCVIHPMFYTRLHINVDQQLVVYPFPDHPDFDLLQENYYSAQPWATPALLMQNAPTKKRHSGSSKRR